MGRRNLELDTHPCVELIAQDLIDLTFEIALAIQSNQEGYFKGKTREEVAKWVAEKLLNCGYPTKPMGCSWGVLTK
jgi:hypothetical protein